MRGISRGSAQRTEQRWVKVGHTWNLVIEDRRAVRNGTVGLAKRTTALATRITKLFARGADR
jgi:hypothetical protein